MVENDGNAFTITLKDVYERMEQGQKATVNTLADINTTLAKLEPLLSYHADHEARIRILERFRFTLTGMALVIGGLSGTGAAWITILVNRHG